MNPSQDPSPSPFPTIEILVEASDPPNRTREPVTCGIPLPKGMLRNDPRYLMLFEEGYKTIPVQTRVLDTWSEGSIRWLLLDWQATVKRTTQCRLELTDMQPAMATAGALRSQLENVTAKDQTYQKWTTISTGKGQFRIRPGRRFPFDEVIIPVSEGHSSVEGVLFVEYDRYYLGGKKHPAWVTQVAFGEPGLIRSSFFIEGLMDGFGHNLPDFRARMDFFSNMPCVRIHFTIRNPRCAKHGGGIWTLGNKGSELLKDVSLITNLDDGPPGIIRFSPDVNSLSTQVPESFGIYQTSSGGDNWQSSNHNNRQGVVANSFSGYRVRSGDKEQTGRRATPIVTLERDGQTIGLAMRYFWQNFPKAIEAGPNSLTLRLFPKQHGDQYELQGGEQKTHEFVIAFGKDEVTPDQPLAWVRSPARVRADPGWYAASGAVPYLIPEAEDPNADYIKLVRAAIEGDDTFEKKREVIDEYGWRNFGEIYADHEAVPKEIAKEANLSTIPLSDTGRGMENRRTGAPLVSHYNNQYDPLAGFAIQFMRSGDWRWWDAMNELAAHVIDIDIYHTDQDKSAYNHGLFWHTVHYTDAGLSTHRSYPRAPGVHGGGPGNEHNYTTGLMLHYFLTGNPQSREAAIGLAQWVIDMDDGTKTIFRWLDRGYTGLASATVSPDYHGPGRGSGNSINALLDGHQLTGDPKFLEKAEQLIRRCIHPADDIAARNLLDVERRWSYTVFLQAMGKYLDFKIEREELDWMYAYARAVLLYYGRWMAEHEHPYLEKSEILEYPTETWVAQDMRKSEVFKYAAKHANGEERARFLERSEFFFRYVTTTLMGMKTRTLARPVVILLSNGYVHAYFQRHPDVAAPPPKINPTDFGKPESFVAQKVRAKKRFVILCGVLAAITLAVFLRWFF